jgi:hypothetical protein
MAPLKAEPCFKSAQCHLRRHEECWISKLCDCECHQVPGQREPTNTRETYEASYSDRFRRSAHIVRLHLGMRERHRRTGGGYPMEDVDSSDLIDAQGGRTIRKVLPGSNVEIAFKLLCKQ